MTKEKGPSGQLVFKKREMQLLVAGTHQDYVELLKKWAKKYGSQTTFYEILLKEAGISRAANRN